MPNQPAKDTVTVSFTLPRDLVDGVDRVAASKMTNRSDIIRRALLEFLPPGEVAMIEASLRDKAATYKTKKKP